MHRAVHSGRLNPSSTSGDATFAPRALHRRASGIPSVTRQMRLSAARPEINSLGDA